MAEVLQANIDGKSALLKGIDQFRSNFHTVGTRGCLQVHYNYEPTISVKPTDGNTTTAEILIANHLHSAQPSVLVSVEMRQRRRYKETLDLQTHRHRE